MWIQPNSSPYEYNAEECTAKKKNVDFVRIYKVPGSFWSVSGNFFSTLLLRFLMNSKHRWITEQKQTSKFTCHGGRFNFVPKIFLSVSDIWQLRCLQLLSVPLLGFPQNWSLMSSKDRSSSVCPLIDGVSDLTCGSSRKQEIRAGAQSQQGLGF